ncbi:hypothetical protein, partial [Escherichia coli]|uniref:hypothetical protein n=1 Tax=Escherichia coli TaxID=562 RepID=UPI003D9BE72D
MSGKPAARQGDMTQYGGSIVPGLHRGRTRAPPVLACSGCPAGARDAIRATPRARST